MDARRFGEGLLTASGSWSSFVLYRHALARTLRKGESLLQVTQKVKGQTIIGFGRPRGPAFTQQNYCTSTHSRFLE